MNFPTQATLSRCTQLAAQLQQATQRSAEHQRLILAVHFVQDHLDCDLSLTEVTAVVRLSVRGFSDLFKDVTDMSPGDYIKLSRAYAQANRGVGKRDR